MRVVAGGCCSPAQRAAVPLSAGASRLAAHLARRRGGRACGGDDFICVKRNRVRNPPLLRGTSYTLNEGFLNRPLRKMSARRVCPAAAAIQVYVRRIQCVEPTIRATPALIFQPKYA